jgi:hypothetical protein
MSANSPRNKTKGNRYRVDAFRRRCLVVTPPFILIFFLDATRRRNKPILPSKQSDGISIMTLRRAKFALGVVSPKQSISGCWNWVLEDEELVNR